MDKNSKLYAAVLVFGPMCSGKSEISKKIAEKKGLAYINPDAFWNRGSGEEFTRDLGNMNFSRAYGQMIYCIQSGKSFLLDSALKRKIDRQEVLTILRDMDSFVPEYNFRIIGIYVASTLDICLKRNKLRPGQQSEEKIKEYHNYFEKEIPSKSEGFDEFYTIINNGKGLPDLGKYLF